MIKAWLNSKETEILNLGLTLKNIESEIITPFASLWKEKNNKLSSMYFEIHTSKITWVINDGSLSPVQSWTEPVDVWIIDEDIWAQE